jgi:hypothetical protein
MGKKVLKIALGIAILPFCAGFTWQLGSNIFSIAYKPLLVYYFIGGGLSYLALHFLFKQPILTYVVGHELTHALFALLFGGSVKAFHATERGGQVTITKSNFLITLAPYFFPLYTCVALILHAAVSAAGHPGPAAALIFLSGASFAFHLVLTLIFLGSDQKDIREEGAFFSLPLIYLFNVIFCALLIHLLLAQKNDFLDYLGNAIIQSIRIWSLIFGAVTKLAV